MSIITLTRTAAVAACLVACGPAVADPITYTVTGTIYSGTDGGGYFGPAGANLTGDFYSVTWIANDCQCIGGSPPSFPLPNPIIDVTITINNHTVDFGHDFQYGEFFLPPGNLDIQQTATSHGTISTSFGFSPPGGGAFTLLDPTTPFEAFMTNGTFIPFPVPGPVVGAGLSSLIMAAVGWLVSRSSKWLRLRTLGR